MRRINWKDVRWNIHSWIFDHRTEVAMAAIGLTGIVILLCAISYDLSLPIVQKDSATGRVVAVVTSDGVLHPPSYFEEKRISRYDVEWVAPRK